MKFYQLTEEIANPKPDRRKKYDWRAQDTVPAGGLYVRIKTKDGNTLAPVDEPNASLPVKHPLIQAMADHLEDHEPSLKEMIAGSQIDPMRVLRAVVKSDDLDLETVETTIKLLLKKDLEA